MDNLQKHIENYLEYCKTQKRLDAKTLKAYRIDLAQFSEYIRPANILEVTPEILESFLQTFINNTNQNRKKKDCVA